jgi:23S rRNA (uracil1939-C5)-methyltransferase
MKLKTQPVHERVEITAVSAEGKAIARINNQVVFISGAVPGDVADIKIIKKHRRFLEGQVVQFHEQSPTRTTPVCGHFGTCGGCKWQHLQYEHQLKYKQQQVHDQLVRIGKLDVPEIQPIVGAQNIYNYRNRLDFGF